MTKSIQNTSILESKYFKIGFLVLYLLIILITFLNVYPDIFEKKIFLGGDNAAYYLLGEAIADGKGYVNAHIINGEPANHYPPGYSYIIAKVIEITGGDIQTVKKLNGFFLLGILYLIFFIVKKISKNIHFSFALVLFCFFNYHMLYYSSIVMSELSFTFFSLTAFLSFLYWDDTKKFFLMPVFYILVLSTVAAIYIRTQGYVLLGLAIVWGVIKKRWVPTGVILGLVFLSLLPWQMRTSEIGATGYSKQLKMKNPYQSSLGMMETSDYFTRAGKNALRYYSKEIPNGIFPSFQVFYTKNKDGVVPSLTASNYILGSVLLIFIVLGALFSEKWKWLILVYLGGNLVVFLLWPDVWFGIRFMLCLIPLLSFLAFFGLYKSVEKLISRMPKLENGTLLGLFVLPFIYFHMAPLQNLKLATDSKYSEQWDNYMRLAKWSKTNIADTAVVACRKPHLFAIESEKTVASFLSNDNRDSVYLDLKRKGVTHVVVESLGFTSTSKYLYPTIQKYNGKFKLVKKIDPMELRKKANPKKFEKARSTGAFLFSFNPELGYDGAFDTLNKRTGYGTFRKEDGSEFSGNWIDNKLDGKGKIIDNKGQIFIGNFVDGKKNGLFEITVPKKGIFEVEFKMGKVVRQRLITPLSSAANPQ